jgi:hypothetical protein
MGQAIPTQHPAVVLRSHFNQLRALLAVALIAIVSLSAAVVILAKDSDNATSTNATRYDGVTPSAPLPPSPVERHQKRGLNGPGMRP